MELGAPDRALDLSVEIAGETGGTGAVATDWAHLVRDIPDFPQEGVSFKDITPVLADAATFAAVVRAIARHYANRSIDVVLGIEARGFILAAPVALMLGAGFVPARKAGKLPWKVVSETYDLEYGSATLEAHADALVPGASVLIVDDVLATGGTAAAAAVLVERLGGTVAGFGFYLELCFLSGRKRLSGYEILALHGVQ